MKQRAYKTQHDLPEVAKALLITGGVNTRKLLDWFIWEIDQQERLEIYQWTQERWYFCVINPTLPSVMNQGRNVAGFTVDLLQDKIIWSNEGGNCFVYTEKWARRIKKQFKATLGRTSWKPDTESQVRDYRPTKSR